MVSKYTLDNGMVILLESIEGVASVSAGLWVKTGSRNEQSGQMGYAHFIEHMLFKGTANYSARDIARMVDRVGGQHNAATNREYTCYYINVISDYLELSVDLLADMYYRSLFDADEISKEKNVILEEIRMYEDTPDELIHDVFMECMLSDHPLGHPILGTIESIDGIDRELGLYEIAQMTRAGPAKALGVGNTYGGLTPGMDADIAVYALNPEDMPSDPAMIEKAFSRCAWLVKDGIVTVRDGEVVAEPAKRTVWVDVKVPEDAQVQRDIYEHFLRHYSVKLDNYSLFEEHLHNQRVIEVDTTQ